MSLNSRLRVFTSVPFARGPVQGAVDVVQYGIIQSLKRTGYQVNLVSLASAKGTVFEKLSKIICDIHNLLDMRNNDITIMFYPALPLVPTTSSYKIPVAYSVYWLYFVLAKLFGKSLMLVVLDLPIEQDEGLEISFTNANRRWYKSFERFLFHRCDWIVSFSKYFTEAIVQTAPLSKGLMQLDFVPYTQHDLNNGSSSVLESSVDDFVSIHRVIVFYSGDLRRERDKQQLSKLINVIDKRTDCGLVVCGPGGDWITKLGVSNVFYGGFVESATHDVMARKCHFGLLLYPNSGYYRWTPTTKFSAYIANGLPILAIDSETIGSNIEKYGVGEAVPETQIIDAFIRWINEECFKSYIANVSELRGTVTNGLELQRKVISAIEGE